MKMNKTFLVIIVVIITLLTFSFYLQDKGVSKENFPRYALRSSEVEVAYKYAVNNSKELKNIPCYCNCEKLGHRSVKDCFVEKVEEERVVFNDHGSNCGICYSTVLDVKKLTNQDKSRTEVRDFIDNKYSQYGQPTDTPRP